MKKRDAWFVLFVPFLIILRRNTCTAYENSADSDQRPPDAASDRGLHCLPMSYKRDVRHYWVNFQFGLAILIR